VIPKWTLSWSSLCSLKGLSFENVRALALFDSRVQQYLLSIHGSGKLARVGRLSGMALEVQ